MKICWIKGGGFVPLDYGGRIRSFQMASALAQRHEVTLVTFYREQADDPHPELRSKFHEVVLIPMRLPASRSAGDLWLYARNLPTGQPHTMAKYYRPEVRRAVNEVFQRNSFDVVVCDFLYPAGLLDWSGTNRIVLFTHNVEAEVWERQARVAPTWMERLASRLEFRALSRAERMYVRRADHIVAVSERNAGFFANLVPRDRITVVSTGVDAGYFAPSLEQEQPDQVVFTGSYDWRPNSDAAEWYFQEILPLIREQIPGLVSWMVGKAPSPAMRRFAEADPSFRVTGRVEDVRPFMAQCPVFIVPMRSGSGTRLKIFEAMAAGKAIVSTSTGAEGLPVEHGRDILLAETPADFAREVVRVLRDPALRLRLGQSARDLVEKRFSWEGVAREFEAVLEKVAGKAPREKSVR